MKQSIHKKWGVILGIVIALSLMSLSGNAWAADDSDEYNCDKIGAASTMGSKGYRTFLAKTLNFRDFNSFFDDIFFLNRCHYEDIKNVQNQFDKISKSIRTAFYKCQTDKIEELKTKYYKLEAELMFLRVFLGEPDRRDFKMYFSSKKGESFKMKDRESFIRPKMKDYLMDKLEVIKDEKTLDKYLDEFIKKYEKAPSRYADCEDKTWEELKKKWKEFRENWGGIGDAFDEIEKQKEKRRKAGKAASWGDVWDNTKEGAKDLGDRLKNFYKPGNLVGINIQVQGLKEFGQLINDYTEAFGKDEPWKKYEDGGSTGGPSYDKLIELQSEDSLRAYYEQLEATMKMDYHALYVQGGASVTMGLTQKLAGMESAIKYMSETVVPAVEECHSYVKRQCDG